MWLEWVQNAAWFAFGVALVWMVLHFIEHPYGTGARFASQGGPFDEDGER